MAGLTEAPVAARPRGRRPQPERTAAMRARLMEATVSCLVEQGWAQTSLPEVVARAGVGRGAQVHHFPTKAALMEATADHLLATQRQAFAASFLSVPPAERTADRAVEALWSIFCGPAWIAVLELGVAGRTDPKATDAIRSFSARLDDTIVEIAHEHFPQVRDNPFGSSMIRGLLAVLSGLALQNALAGDPGGHRTQVYEHVKLLAQVLVPPAPPPPA